MLKSLFTGLLAILGQIAIAQDSCPGPDKRVAVFFGNGINTTRDSAASSLELLRAAIGDSYVDQQVSYDLAYNRTSGIAADLAQASAQAGVQFSSQFMAWLNGMGVAPDWFSDWYKKFTSDLTNVVADEVAEHVTQYTNAIASGQKVLVVSHSQGNFYVNEAKAALVQQLSAEKQNSFSIFGIAVPSNNVGGGAGPYYTDDRDFIQYIPGAMKANWALHHVDGSSATDVGPIQAHLFNDAYMSKRFDIRPVLLIGIKAQINAAQLPTPECGTYRQMLLSIVAGSYETCDRTLVANTTGVTNLLDGHFVNLTGVNTEVVIAKSNDIGRGIEFGGKTPWGDGAGLSWNPDGTFVASGADCGNGRKVTTTSIGMPVEITATMMKSLNGYYRLFPDLKCASLVGGEVKPIRADYGGVPVYIEGTTVHVGGHSLDFAVGLSSESSSAVMENGTVPADYDPGFSITSLRAGGGSVVLEYRRLKGLRFVSISDGSDFYTCGTD